MGDSVDGDSLHGHFTVKLVWRLSQGSMESDNFHGDSTVKVVWRLSGNLI